MPTIVKPSAGKTLLTSPARLSDLQANSQVFVVLKAAA
jgi:hypothetical protein